MSRRTQPHLGDPVEAVLEKLNRAYRRFDEIANALGLSRTATHAEIMAAIVRRPPMHAYETMRAALGRTRAELDALKEKGPPKGPQADNPQATGESD